MLFGASTLQVPSIGVDAPAVAESVVDGGLTVPPDPHQVGWWMPSPHEVVLDGHVDMEGVGPGALFELQHLEPGAPVTVTTPDGSERWVVDGVRSYTKGSLPAGLFDSTTPELVMITCGGSFDAATHHYADNVVAYASPGT